MSKQHHIRWQESDLQELNRVVRNFNAKLRRIEKKNPEMKKALPDKVDPKKLINQINTRQDLKRELNSLKRFSKRGSEEVITYGDYNIKLTKWQKEEMSIQVGVINRRRKARKELIEQVELTSAGNPLGYQKKDFGMGKVETLQYRPMTALTPKMTQRDLKKKWKSIKKQIGSEFYNKLDFQWRDNYIESLTQNFNEEDIKDVIEHVKNMDISDFTKKMRAEVDAFEKSYPPNRTEYPHYVEELKSLWLPNKQRG